MSPCQVQSCSNTAYSLILQLTWFFTEPRDFHMSASRLTGLNQPWAAKTKKDATEQCHNFGYYSQIFLDFLWPWDITPTMISEDQACSLKMQDSIDFLDPKKCHLLRGMVQTFVQSWHKGHHYTYITGLPRTLNKTSENQKWYRMVEKHLLAGRNRTLAIEGSLVCFRALLPEKRVKRMPRHHLQGTIWAGALSVSHLPMKTGSRSHTTSQNDRTKTLPNSGPRGCCRQYLRNSVPSGFSWEKVEINTILEHC